MSEFPHLQIVIDSIKADLKCTDEVATEHAILGSASLARAAGVKVPENLTAAVMDGILETHGLKLEAFANKAVISDKPDPKRKAPRAKAKPRKKKPI